MEALSLPFGHIQDLVAVYQIREEGLKKKLTKEEEEEDFERLLSWK